MGGDLSRHLPITALSRLADLLGESPIGLDQPALHTASDPADVGALLAHTPGGATRDQLAYALNWTLDRLERAVGQLDTDLKAHGLRILAVDGRLRIGPQITRIDPGTRIRVARATNEQTDPQIALLVHRLAKGMNSHATQDTIDAAHAQGHIDGGWWHRNEQLSDDVRYSLCLDDRHH